MIKNFNKIWEDFWYESHHPNPRNVKFGGSYNIRKVFRKQRLINIIILMALLLILTKI